MKSEELKIGAGVALLFVVVIALVYVFFIKPKEDEKFVGYVDEAEVKIQEQPTIITEEAEPKKRVRFADGEIKSSANYGFKKLPPSEPVLEKNPNYSGLPVTYSQTGQKFGFAKGRTCFGNRTDLYIDSVLPECANYCDNNCTAFVYNERNGDCSIFGSCTDLKEDRNSIAFVRV